MKSAESRVLLNKTLAIEIYQTKLTLAAPTSFESCLKDSRIKMRGKSAKLSKIYGVSAKTIRDIWNRKTWANATNHLWDQEPMFMEVDLAFICRIACLDDFKYSFLRGRLKDPQGTAQTTQKIPAGTIIV
jgi:hypothetical protein